jgi:hypothetical protein
LQEQLVKFNRPFVVDLNSPFYHLTNLNEARTARDESRVKNFIKNAYEYNRLFQFGSASINAEQMKKQHFSVMKINGVLHFNAFGFIPPQGQQADPSIFAQVYTLR